MHLDKYAGLLDFPHRGDAGLPDCVNCSQNALPDSSCLFVPKLSG